MGAMIGRRDLMMFALRPVDTVEPLSLFVILSPGNPLTSIKISGCRRPVKPRPQVDPCDLFVVNESCPILVWISRLVILTGCNTTFTDSTDTSSRKRKACSVKAKTA